MNRRAVPAFRGPAELIPLSVPERVHEVFGVWPDTIRDWNAEGWFPLFCPRGKGPGKPAYIPVAKARAAIEHRSA